MLHLSIKKNKPCLQTGKSKGIVAPGAPGAPGAGRRRGGNARKKKTPKGTKKTGLPPNVPAPVLIEASKALPTSIDGIGLVPRRLSSFSTEPFNFEHVHSVLKSITESNPESCLFLTGGVLELTCKDQEHRVPLIQVLITPKGAVPPTWRMDRRM